MPFAELVSDPILRYGLMMINLHRTVSSSSSSCPGESVIQTIRDKQPGYNLITNNCQTYALQLLDAIKAGVEKEFATTLAVYERLTGEGKVADLFQAQADQEQQQQADGKEQGPNTVLLAQQVMNDNTNQLDTQDQARSTEGSEEPKKGFFSRFRKK